MESKRISNQSASSSRCIQQSRPILSRRFFLVICRFNGVLVVDVEDDDCSPRGHLEKGGFRCSQRPRIPQEQTHIQQQPPYTGLTPTRFHEEERGIVRSGTIRFKQHQNMRIPSVTWALAVRECMPDFIHEETKQTIAYLHVCHIYRK